MEQGVVDHFRLVADRLEIPISPDGLRRLAISVHAVNMGIGETERNKNAADLQAAARQVAAIIEALY